MFCTSDDPGAWIPMQELRRHPRMDFDRRVWCEHQNLTLYLAVSNVSLGGMFLQTSAPFHRGETIRVSMDLEGDAEAVIADVEIVWAGRNGRGAGVGCRLLRFAEGEQLYTRLIDHLASRVSRIP
jgi:Tfp pilus assembly protein PilZ